jgi:hypothetical protein
MIYELLLTRVVTYVFRPTEDASGTPLTMQAELHCTVRLTIN